MIAVANQKGGVTKTTTTMNLGAVLARKGKKVLLIDADAQGDLTTCMGWKDNDALDVTLATLMNRQIQQETVNWKEAVLHHEEGMDLIPSNLELSGMELMLVNAMSRENILRNTIQDVKKEYDYILIDCAPTLGILTVNALSAADSVLIPVQAQYLPAKGMTQLVKTIGSVKRQINPKLRIEGIVLTLVDRRTNLSREIAETLRENYGSAIHIFDTQIPVAVKAALSSTEGKSIFAYDRKSPVAEAYEKLGKEVLTIDGRRKEKLRSSEAR